ncbi:MAG: C39 family peptidase [bacterium]|nr:C39 family peptidase [bacterium]
MDRRQNNYIKKTYRLLVFAAFLSVVGFAYTAYNARNDLRKQSDTEVATPKKEVVQSDTPQVKGDTVQIKDSASLPVPYTLQGPLNNLNVHEESCEEAAVLMYHYFLEGQLTFNGSTIITPQLANDEMLKMKAWQVKNYGKEPDLSIEQLGLFAQQYYGYKYKTFKNVTKDDIKREISAGHPVLVPVMTHSLKNPMYGPQTTYHILVIKGYNAQNVIANDAGIRGESIQYSWDTVFSAIDAQTPKMGQGREMVILTK